MSKIFVDEMRGNTSTTISIPSGQTLNVAGNLSSTSGSISGTPSFPDGAKVNTIKHTGGTTGLTIDSTGRILTPARPMFEVGKNAGQALASGTITKVTWQTEAYDVGGNFASDKFIAPIAGKYFMSVYLTWQTMVAGAGIGLIWYKNGSVFKHAHHQSTEVNITFGMHNATVFNLAASDYIELYAFQGSGSSRELGQGNNVGSGTNANSNYWTGHLIG